jgi:hypothetical protein
LACFFAPSSIQIPQLKEIATPQTTDQQEVAVHRPHQGEGSEALVAVEELLAVHRQWQVVVVDEVKMCSKIVVYN